MVQFKELSTLQRWIVEGKVSAADKWSTDGHTWELLGSVSELRTFFDAVGALAATSQGASVPRNADGGHRSGPYEAAGFPGIDVGRRFKLPITPNFPSIADNEPGHSGTWGSSESGIAVPSADAGDADAGRGDDLADLSPRKRSKGKWVFVLAVLVIGAAGATYVFKPALVRPRIEQFLKDPWVAQLLGGVSPQAEVALAAGYAALRQDTQTGIERALNQFNEALSDAPEWSDAEAAIAEGLLQRAEAILDEAELRLLSGDAARVPQTAADAPAVLDQEGAADVAANNDDQALQKQVDELTQKAFERGKEALHKDAGGLRPNRAMAEYYRLGRAADKAQLLLDRARAAAPPQGDARLCYTQGMLAWAGGDREVAKTRLQEALKLDGDSVRARYGLAKVLASGVSPDREGAVAALTMVLAMEPGHARAKARLALLGAPTPDEGTEQPDGEAAPAGDLKERPSEVAFVRLLRQADGLRRSDRPGRALPLYRRAIALDGDNPEGYTGMGWCYVDLERPDEAMVAFRQALEWAPKYAEAHFGIGEAYRLKGMKQEAIECYRNYLDILPSGPDAPVARSMLERLSE